MTALTVATHPQAASAQIGCVSETEPNDTEQTATPVSGPWCVEGTLPQGDQDLAVWTIPTEDITTRWTITLDGVPGTQNLLQFFVVTTEPDQGVLLVESRPLLEFVTALDDTEPVVLTDVLLPSGRYLVAIARGSPRGGGEPKSIAYRYAIEPGDPWPASADVEPNDDASSAQKLTDAFEVSGDRQGSSSDFYSWTVTNAGRWDLTLAAPLGETIGFHTKDAAGLTLDSASDQTEARLFDLQLDAGTYEIRVPETGAEPRPYVLLASPAMADGDSEPNGDTLHATPIEDGLPVRGRLAKAGDRDRFVLTVPGGQPMLRDVRMLWRSGTDRTLCLLDDADTNVVCRRAAEGLTLTNLLLAPGRHAFDVSGANDPSDIYVLRVDIVGPAVPDFETEPNEDVESATLLDPSLGMRARGGPEDRDLFHLRTEGEPQLWQVELTGSDISRVELVRASGVELARGDVADDGRSATLADLYLVPGDHWLRVSSTGPEYSVEALPLGPPDPDGEREPNDETTRAGRYRIGDRRVGRLPTASDRDVYRFTLAAPQHVRLDLEQPSDAATAIRVSTGDELVFELAGLPAGDPISAELWLEPGDHFVELIPEQPSDERYEFTSARLDPFAGQVDREPNGGPSLAASIPASLSWSGAAGDADDEDWYVIPPLMAAGELRIATSGDDPRVRLMHADEGTAVVSPVPLDKREDGSLVAVEPPLGEPLYLAVSGAATYEVRLDGAGLEPAGIVPALPVTLAWDLTTDAIAAYWPDEQVIEATLEIANEGSRDLELELETTTSDYRWRASLGADRVHVPGGVSAQILATIVAAPDAWADEPVQVSVRATAPDGGWTSSSVDVEASRDDPPVLARPGWDIPVEILGGLNAASLALGAQPGGTLDAERERDLFDGVTPDGGGFTVFAPDHTDRLPLEIKVDLAGEDALPVVATIINPQARDGHLDELPRDFELLLSDDNATWVPVLDDRLSPLPIDQVYLLDEPVMATHAMLRLESTGTDLLGYVSLGEWKVVVAPGTTLSPGPVNIAAPGRGGHVITMEPFDADEGTGALMLDEEPSRTTLDFVDGPALDLVIGFQGGRAAQVTDLEWQDPTGTLPTERIEHVDVFTSTYSPVGPWQGSSRWVLRRSPDGSVAPFTFDDSTWVRYLRLVGRPPAEAERIELPGVLRVIERSTDSGYRSILGEWGYRSTQGPYEWLEPAGLATWDPALDAGDSQAQATPLAAGLVVADRAEIDVDEDWFLIDVPGHHNSLEISLDGRPTIGVQPTLFDAEGEPRPMAVQREPDGGLRYVAEAEAGTRYALRLRQPPFSAVFAFDTSASMDPFLDMVIQGMRSFLGDVRPGREVVTILPFEEPALVDGWQDDPYLLQDAFDNHVVEAQGSSGVEASLVAASGLLEEQEGARAILLVTDAETTTFDRTPDLWAQLSQVRPIIFSVHIGAVDEPLVSRQRMQAWAASGGGAYAYPTTHGEMDRAFDRMATWLRRPAAYTLSYETLDVTPARLSVVAPSGEAGSSTPSALASGVGVEIILDTSGSMRTKLGGKRRIDIAKASLRSLLGEAIAEGTPVAIRTFGDPKSRKTAKCATNLALPLGPLDRDAALKMVKKLTAQKKTRTPITAALEAVAQDLAAVDGLRSVVLVTDGEESCGGDPMAAIAALREAGIDIKLDVVGFALKDETTKAQMATWARAGGGAYLDAADAVELTSSMETALSAPFRVRNLEGETVASGTVGGEAVELDRGVYRVEVLVEPPLVFERVELGNGEVRALVFPAAPES